jgi:hypothetical protein
VGELQQCCGPPGLQPGVLERGEQVQRGCRMAGVGRQDEALLTGPPEVGPVDGGQPAVVPTRRGDGHDDGLGTQLLAGQQGDRQAVRLVVLQAGAVHQGRAPGRGMDGQQVGRGEHGLGGARHYPVKHGVQVATADQIGGRSLQGPHLPAQRGQLEVGAGLATAAPRQPHPRIPAQVVRARRVPVGLALVVDDAGPGQTEDRRHRGQQPLRVLAVQPRVRVTGVQREFDGRVRGGGLDDRHGRGGGELQHRAGQPPEDLPR